MSATIPQFVRGLSKSKYLMSVAAALMLSACSNTFERLAENPSDADPVYTASVPKKNAATPSSGNSDDTITSRPLANAAVNPPVYNYKTSSKPSAYKQPALTLAGSAGGQVTVAQGMTLYSIARANDLTVAELAAANQINPPYSVHTGQVLRIPGSGQAMLPETAAASPSRKPHSPAKTAASGGELHEVGSGDTLFSLGRKYGVSPYSIADANGLSHASRLKLGQKVKIPGGSGSTMAQKPSAAQPKLQTQASAEEASAPDETVVPAPAKTKAITEQVPQPDVTAPPAANSQIVVEAPPMAGSSTGMRWPVRGKVISGFGSKPNGLKNEGINISVPEGTSIRAAEGGVIAYAGNELKGYGNLVLIRHEGGYVTAYAHAKELFVKRGDSVKRGDVIAKAGQTGSVSSPQLHFEVRKGATALDPIKFLSSSTASN